MRTDLNLVTHGFADAVVLRALVGLELAIDKVNEADAALGKQLVEGAWCWLKAIRRSDEHAVAEAVGATRTAYRALLANSRVSETTHGRALGTAAAKLAAALCAADRARCMAAVIARDGA